jgi:hypothetical protein
MSKCAVIGVKSVAATGPLIRTTAVPGEYGSRDAVHAVALNDDRRGRVSMVGDSDFADFLRVILDVVLSVRS